jgi:hypothetical protein
MPMRSPRIPSALVAAAVTMAATSAQAQSEPQQDVLANTDQIQPEHDVPAPAAPTEQDVPTPEPATTDAPSLVPQPCSDERPWYCGVSEDDKQRAMEIYEQGNQLFDDSLFLDAVTSYRDALALWDHPGIHYNLMLALVALDHAIEAYKSSTEALRYGPNALEPEEYRRARDYHRLLRGRIAELTVACDEPGAEVTLNGKIILRCPGEAHVSVLPGQHELVARKPGYLATHHTLVLVPQELASVHLRMLPTAKALVTTRRWNAWQPWAVVGAGAGVGLLGGLLEWRSYANNHAFQALFQERCLHETGCMPAQYTDEMTMRQHRYRWYRRLGHGATVVGGTAMLGGLVLVYFNNPRQIENPERQRLVRTSVTPILTPDSAGLSLDLSF